MGWIIIAVIILLVIVIISMYNGLVRLRQKVKNAWSQIEVQLQRRFDLLPNLFEMVNSYMKHEKEVLSKVTELRTSWSSAKSVGEKAELDNQLSSTLKTIMAISENYPDLKANQNFIQVQEELRSTENKISYARQFYNDTVTMYNTKLQTVPTNIIASAFNFQPEELFKTTSEEAKQNVKYTYNV